MEPLKVIIVEDYSELEEACKIVIKLRSKIDHAEIS